MPYQYHPASDDQIAKMYQKVRRSGQDQFFNKDNFFHWYYRQYLACPYCGLTEHNCQEVIMTGLITSEKFTSNAEITDRKSRGLWFELDRLDPHQPYDDQNCVMCCYFCKNDKSDIFTAAQYLEFRSDRGAYISNLLSMNNH